MADARRGTADDLGLIARIAAAGFFDDPLMGWLVPDAATRPARLTLMFTGLGTDMLERGTVHITDDASVAMWRAPGFDHHTVPPPDDRPSPFTPDEIERFAILRTAMRKHHPHQAHWYLNVLSTSPSRQGRGLGAASMRPVLEICDAEGIPAYLESSNPRNLTLYRRHGFVETGEIRLTGGPSLTPMWREPAG